MKGFADALGHDEEIPETKLHELDDMKMEVNEHQTIFYSSNSTSVEKVVQTNTEEISILAVGEEIRMDTVYTIIIEYRAYDIGTGGFIRASIDLIAVRAVSCKKPFEHVDPAA